MRKSFTRNWQLCHNLTTKPCNGAHLALPQIVVGSHYLSNWLNARYHHLVQTRFANVNDNKCVGCAIFTLFGFLVLHLLLTTLTSSNLCYIIKLPMVKHQQKPCLTLFGCGYWKWHEGSLIHLPRGNSKSPCHIIIWVSHLALWILYISRRDGTSLVRFGFYVKENNAPRWIWPT